MNIRDETFYNRVCKKINNRSNRRYYVPKFSDFCLVEQSINLEHPRYKGIDYIEYEVMDSVVRDLSKNYNLGNVEHVSFAYGVSVLYWYRDSDLVKERVIYNKHDPFIVFYIKGSTGLFMIFVDTSVYLSDTDMFTASGVYYSGSKSRYSFLETVYTLPLRSKVYKNTTQFRAR